MDRAAVAAACVSVPESRIVVTHGTSTMIETAAVIAAAVAGEPGKKRRTEKRQVTHDWASIIFCRTERLAKLSQDELQRKIGSNERKKVDIDPPVLYSAYRRRLLNLGVRKHHCVTATAIKKDQTGRNNAINGVKRPR